MRRPLVGIALVFCSGIFAADVIRIPFASFCFLAALALFLCALSLKKRFIFDLFLLFASFLLGSAVFKNSQVLPPCHIAKFAYYKNNNLYTVKGFIDTQPATADNRVSFVFQAEEIRYDNIGYNCCGGILVYLKSVRALAYGQELLISGKLYRPFNRLPGAGRRSYRDYLSGQGIYAIMSARAVKQAPLGPKRGWGLAIKRVAFALKQRMEGVILKRLPALSASVLDAMILGEKRNIPAPVSDSMMKTGTVHILVVSGFNVGIVAFIVVLFLKLIRVPRRLRLLLAIPCLAVYVFMTGSSTPVVRAAVMFSLFMLGRLFRREPDIYNSCALAALSILAVNPRQLFDIGFQLSFASVISIIYLYPRIKSLVGVEFLKIKPLKFLSEGCLVSLSAWLGTMGFIAYYFKIFSPVTVLANIFIVPLATLITLCGFSLIFIDLVFPALSPPLASASELMILSLLKINSLLLQVPAAHFCWR